MSVIRAMLFHMYVLFVVMTIRSFPHWWLARGIVTRVTRRAAHVVQGLSALPEHPSSSPVSTWGSCCSIFGFMYMFCISLLFHLSSFIWSLCCLSFFKLRLLVIPLISSNFYHCTLHCMGIVYILQMVCRH